MKSSTAENFNRAIALFHGGKLDDAEGLFKQVLRVDPRHLGALNLLGISLTKRERYSEAETCLLAALEISVSDVTLYNYAIVLKALRRPAEAFERFTQALAINPNIPETWNNRGTVLKDLKRFEDALADFDKSIALKPDYADALHNKGNSLAELRHYDQALAAYDKALLLNPNHAQVWFSRGRTLGIMKRNEDAAKSLTRAIELVPDYSFAKGNLIHQKMLCCDWAQFDSLVKSIEQDIRAGRKSAEPFGYQAVSDSASNLRRCAEIYAAEMCSRSQVQLWSGERYDNAKIRLGYLSGEFCNHATAILMAGVFEQHDKNCFELFAFDNGQDDGSEIRKRINSAFDRVIGIADIGDLEAATIIKSNKIDILVDLNGYAGFARSGVFSLRPAPIQVNYLGFPGTMGTDYMDYILADGCVIPLDHAAYYSEKIVYLPDTYQANDSKRTIADHTPTRSEVGLPTTGFVFCCFNNNYKISPEIFDIWMRLLINFEGSVLWLFEQSVEASRNLKREAEQRGVAQQRLVFAPRVRLQEHLARHRLADLFLDTLPYNAHTTASDALWAGLPLLTCRGNAFAGRVAASLLHAVGLPELVTGNLADYEALALKLAREPALLAEIKAKLARNRDICPLFDTARFTRHIEAAYTTMWEKYQRGEAPKSFAVQQT